MVVVQLMLRGRRQFGDDARQSAIFGAQPLVLGFELLQLLFFWLLLLLLSQNTTPSARNRPEHMHMVLKIVLFDERTARERTSTRLVFFWFGLVVVVVDWIGGGGAIFVVVVI